MSDIYFGYFIMPRSSYKTNVRTMKLKQSLRQLPEILFVSYYIIPTRIISRSENTYMLQLWIQVFKYLYFHVHKIAQPFITKQIKQRMPEKTPNGFCSFFIHFSLRRWISTKLSENEENGKLLTINSLHETAKW